MDAMGYIHTYIVLTSLPPKRISQSPGVRLGPAHVISCGIVKFGAPELPNFFSAEKTRPPEKWLEIND